MEICTTHLCHVLLWEMDSCIQNGGPRLLLSGLIDACSHPRTSHSGLRNRSFVRLCSSCTQLDRRYQLSNGELLSRVDWVPDLSEYTRSRRTRQETGKAGDTRYILLHSSQTGIEGDEETCRIVCAGRP